MKFRFTFLLPMIPMFIGCTPIAVITPTSPDTFEARATDYKGIFGSMESLKSDVDKQILEFAQGKGQKIVTLSTTEHPVGIRGDWAWYAVTFRLEDPSKRVNMASSSASASANSTSSNQNPTSAIDACLKSFEWQKGNAVARVKCIDSSWNDYDPEAAAFVSEFKKQRELLAKRFDNGSIDTTEFNQLEAKAKNKMIEDVKKSVSVKSYASVDGSHYLIPSNFGFTAQEFAAEILGQAAALAPAAAAYGIGSNGGFNSGYNYGTRPRILTCVPVGGGVSSCN